MSLAFDHGELGAVSMTGGPNRFGPGVPLRKPSSISRQSPDDWDKPNQHQPAGFVTVVEALDIDDDPGDRGSTRRYR